MDFTYGWLLNLICYLPLAGALLIAFFIKKENTGAIKLAATAIAAIDFVLSLPLWFLYRTDGAEFQFATSAEWIPSVGVQYLFGVDGFAVLLILLTTLLSPLALEVSWNSVNTKVKEFAISFLLLQVGMLGAFVALDLFLPYGVAFKLVSVSGLLLFPLACWAFGRLAAFRHPIPELMCFRGLAFALEESFSIYGGKLTSHRITAERVIADIRNLLPRRAARADTRTLVLPRV